MPNLFADPGTAIQQFRFTATGQRGQRNVIRGDKYESVDAGLIKTFKLPREGMSLVLHWDVFNVFNRTNLANPDSNVDDATAGQITSIVDFKRRMQIGAHLTF